MSQRQPQAPAAATIVVSVCQKAYMACRAGGISRVTGPKVLAYMANAKELLSHGSSITLQCHGVPVENFSSGLPESLKEFLKTPEELADFGLIDDLDMSRFHLLDGCVPRDPQAAGRPQAAA